MEIASAIVEKLREKAQRYSELEALINDPEIVSDPKRFPQILRERGQLEAAVELSRRLEALMEERAQATALLEDEATEEEMRALAEEELSETAEKLEALDKEIKGELVSDADLKRTKVIVEIRAGTGGDEATLFAADLLRMYTRYMEAKRWKHEVLSQATSEVGGFREIVLAVQGEGAWNYFRFESGGHRVQRVPQTETQGRIHTSAATVAVLPEAEDVDIEIKDEDLRVDTMRASGPGGQSVNKTSSAVRITHLPTNTVVSCQDEKSQHKNRAKALRILRTRLFDAERERLHQERAEERKTQVGTGDRSQRVRTYNYPQNRVSDHRLNRNFSLEQVVAGRLDPILDALCELDREERIKSL